MPSVQWLKPAPLWEFAEIDYLQPWLVESRSDRFVPDFLDLVGGRLPGQTAADLKVQQPELTEGALKLYQPMHGRYYLVVGSLVCRQLGLPDRTVARQAGERTSFVLRRLDPTAGEQGWVPDTGWVALDGQTLLAGEERQPVHHVAVCTPPGPVQPARPDALALPCAGRLIYYGYVPVASREKYLPKVAPADALAALQAHQPDPGRQAEDEPRLGEIVARVVKPWHNLYDTSLPPVPAPPPQPSPPIAATTADVSLYLILDLGEFLKRVLPTVWAAILSGDPNSLGTASRNLYDDLHSIVIGANPGGTMPLTDALKELEHFLPLVQGDPPDPGYGPDPPRTYTLTGLSTPPGGGTYESYLRGAPNDEGRFRQRLRLAIAEAGTPAQVPEEVADMIRLDPPEGDTYVIRLVYEYPPCDPVVSAPTPAFTLAKIFDPDAPARHIRVELPSIKNLRKYKRGVGMETTPDLRTIMDQVNQGMLNGGPLAAGVAWDLGMICSFSIPIITLVAFIVMFIFLIAFNFIFWWMLFLKICFPIPIPKAK